MLSTILHSFLLNLLSSRKKIFVQCGMELKCSELVLVNIRLKLIINLFVGNCYVSLGLCDCK
jgi:hypothetical protein